jgi:DNA gyrase subunit A
MADDQNPELPLTPPPPGEGGNPGALNIQPVNIEEEMRRSYLDYSMSVIIGRESQIRKMRQGCRRDHG